MPTVSRAFIKAGIVFFLIAALLGVAMFLFEEKTAILTPLFWHSLMLGWITQIIIGVSLWMFPGRSKTEDRKSQRLSWAIFGSLNLALILRLLCEPFAYSADRILINVGLLISSILHVAAAIGYVGEMWPRVISREKQLAKKKKKQQTRSDATN